MRLNEAEKDRYWRDESIGSAAEQFPSRRKLKGGDLNGRQQNDFYSLILPAPGAPGE